MEGHPNQQAPSDHPDTTPEEEQNKWYTVSKHLLVEYNLSRLGTRTGEFATYQSVRLDAAGILLTKGDVKYAFIYILVCVGTLTSMACSKDLYVSCNALKNLQDEWDVAKGLRAKA